MITEKNKTSTKLSESSRAFLAKLAAHLTTSGTEKFNLDFDKTILRIQKYFKLNNDRYLELLKVQDDKNV